MSMKALPPITNLQYLVLDALHQEERAGRDLRELLASFGIKNSAPAFYQMMARLESAGLAEGWYDQKLVGGQNVKEQRYRLTRAGARAAASTRQFYLARAGVLSPARRGAHG